MNIKNVKHPATFIKRVERDMQNNSSRWCDGSKIAQERVLNNLENLALREEPKGENRGEILQVMKQIIKLYKSPYEGRIDSKVNRKEARINTKDGIEIKRLDDTQRHELANILVIDTEDIRFKEIENVLESTARKQQIMDSLELPNKTNLTRLFRPIKNNLNKINERYDKLPFEVRCLLDLQLYDIREGYKNSFKDEVDGLNEVIDAYISRSGTKNKSLPEGQYADSVVPIADAVKTIFSDIPIKSHRNSRFHKIIRFYFEQYLNVPRENYTYIIDQALSSLK